MENYYYANGKKQPLFVQPDAIAVQFAPGRSSDDASSLVARRVLQDNTTDTAFIARYGIHVFRVHGGTSYADNVDAVFDALTVDPNVQMAARAFRIAEHAQPDELMFVTRRFLVQFQPWVGRDQITVLNRAHDVRVVEPLDYAPNGFVLEAPSASGPKGVVELANLYYESGLVKFSHPDFIRSRATKAMPQEAPRSRAPQARTRRTEDTTKWHLDQISAPRAWEVSKGSKAVVIAILDDGVDVDHPELAGRISGQYDFESDTPDGRPKSSTDKHGTSCAGVAVASGLKASGSAPQCSLMAVRTPAYLGVDDEARMFKWVADQGADVISCSWGPPDGRGPFAMPDNVAAAIEYCVSSGRKGLGIPIFFAAGNGNESVSEDGYASNPNVMAVGACTDGQRRSPYSDHGREVFICAPSSGGNERIFTTDRRGVDGYNAGDATLGDAAGDYTSKFGGTSSASPLVAGVAGLILSVNPSLACADVRRILASTAEKIGADEGDYAPDWQGSTYTRSPQFGFGRVHAHGAVQAARTYVATTTPTTATTPTSVTTTSVTGPASMSRDGDPPTFHVDLEAGRYYIIELAADPGFASTSAYFAAWDQPARSEPSYTLSPSAWASLGVADRIYYRIWTTNRPDAWVETETGPTLSMAITTTATASPRDDIEVTGPTIVGPESIDDIAQPPSMLIDVGEDRYYAVEVAADWRLLDARNAEARKTAPARTFYATWRGATARLRTGTSGRTVFRLPEHAWAQLREASALYYRVIATSNADPSNWDGIAASTLDQDAATAPRMRIRNQQMRLRADRDELFDVEALREWGPLLSFRPSLAIQRALQDRTVGAKDWPVQHIEDAKGKLSLDYYSVRITAMPQLDGRRATAESLLDYVRRHINELIDTNVCEFTPYDTAEETLWSSASPAGAVVHIDMKDSIVGASLNVDDGSVVCAESTATHWIFSTIWTVADGEHPVSGNREFGISVDGSGAQFYTRGADRPTGLIDSSMSGAVFGAADKLWRSLLAGVIRLCVDNGGAAQIERISANRYDWDAVSAELWKPTTDWLD